MREKEGEKEGDQEVSESTKLTVSNRDFAIQMTN